ncbi:MULTISPECIES: TIGR03943 family protein [Thermoactinomyces]|jgi:putative membrane protein|uniref:TIGR03943 family protein n=1 Tax=Thermoactinomyces daqus TaxID=1329516 RepID=A0A7W2AGH4_9BACL|nr:MULTISPECIES: TIGR03943 family protein [Thermoactinomyces]MBA4541651.1 TIGR03943 family protein [Thermoactinomyces daqus]MBH8597648.1 TIGR03943 family protein [Thermoactinomyces sp. CICC 10523]MBH8603989.1 TIGR03943 family protein [Thermoactinomyces sp. CICC 10522]
MTAILRTAILIGNAIMLLYLLVTKNIDLFINPRLKWLVAISIFLLLVLGLIQLWNLKEKDIHRTGFWGYGFVIFPLFMFFLFPPKVLDGSIANHKMFTYLSSQPDQKVLTKSQSDQNNDGKNSTDKGQSETLSDGQESWEAQYKKEAAELVKMPVITFNDQNYFERLNVILLYPEKFKGKKIRTMGFVYRDESFKSNQFVPGRMAVSCCVADAAVVGILAEDNHADSLKKDRWVEVEGTLKTEKIEGEITPVIKVESVKFVSPPKNPYIYPS